MVYMPFFMAKMEIFNPDDGTRRVVDADAQGSDIVDMIGEDRIVQLRCVSGDEPRRRAAIVFAAEETRFPMDIARILADGSTNYKLIGAFSRIDSQHLGDSHRWELA